MDYIINIDFLAGSKNIGAGLACSGLAGAGVGIGTVLEIFLFLFTKSYNEGSAFYLYYFRFCIDRSDCAFFYDDGFFNIICIKKL
jgi:hypothetical protein